MPDRALTVHSARAVAIAVFTVIAAFYVTPLFVPDPSLLWAANDEICCHVLTIKAIQQEGLLTAVTDYKHYRSATTPLYHMLMSVVLGRVDPLLIRIFWIVVALGVGWLLYRHVRTDSALRRGERAAVAITIAFLLSPTVRASAVYFLTDGLAVHLAIGALVLLRRARAGAAFSAPLAALAIILGFASFYTRQYYLWATVYVAYSVFSDAPGASAKVAVSTGCLLLAVPAVGLFRLWHGFTTPLGFRIHTDPVLLSTVPNALGLLTIYSLPLAWIALRDTVSRTRLSVWMFGLGGITLYIAIGLVLGFKVPQEGGILRVVYVFGSLGPVVFLLVSSVGLIMLLRWVVVDGPWQLWWVVFLLPLFAGSVLLQRYFEPAILVFMFLVARPRDALQVLDSPLVWYYPLFTAVYALSRTIYFAANL